MANVVYADPFGSYVKGQQEGTQQAIQVGQAARAFRREDLSPEVQAWYLPHIKARAEMQQQQEQLATNKANLQMLASMSASGDPKAQKMFSDFVEEATGGNVKLDFSKNTPEQTAWVMGIMSGQIPMALLNRDVFASSGTQRYGFLGNTPGMQGQPTTAQEYPIFTTNSSWMGGGATPNFGNVQAGVATQYGAGPKTPTQAPSNNIFATPTLQSPTITPLPEQPPAKVEPLPSLYGFHGAGGFETQGGSGVIEHNYPPTMPSAPAPTQMPTMTVKPPVNAPTVAPSIWHDEVEQERVRGPMRQAATL